MKVNIMFIRKNSINWEIFSYYLFIEDLIKDEKRLKIEFSPNQFLKVYYDIKTKLRPKFSSFTQVPNSITKEEDKGFITNTMTSRKFMEAITPFRRFKNDILEFLSKKNPIFEAFLFFFFCLIIYKPYFFLMILFLFLSFGNFKYKLRKIVIKKVMTYFEPNEGLLERVQKNLNFIKAIQIKGLAFVDLLEDIFDKPNRIYLYFTFRIGVILFLLGIMFVLFLFRLKLFFYTLNLVIFV